MKSFWKSSKWLTTLIIGVIFMAGLLIRLYDLTDLPLDFHPTRQLQSMIKARGMFYQTTAIQPEWQREEAIGQWKAMPTEEPEIIETLAAWSYHLAGRESLWIARLEQILFWLAGGAALYLLLIEMTAPIGAIAGTAFYLFLPYGIYASRSFQPDILNLALILWALWAARRWSQKMTWGWTVAAGLLAGLAIYSKVTAVFMVGGGITGLVLGSMKTRQALRNPKVWVVAILALLPAIIYHGIGLYIIPFLGKMTSLRIFPKLLLDPVFYLGWSLKIEQVIGVGVLLLALLGTLLLRNRKDRALMIGLWAAYLVYGVIFAYYYQSHDYYHLPLIPIAAIGIAALADLVYSGLVEAWPKPAWLRNLFLVGIVLFGLVFTLRQVQNTLKKTDYRPEAAMWEKIGDLLHHDGSKSIAMTQDYGGRLMYWGHMTASYWLAAGDLRMRTLGGQQVDVSQMFQEETAGKKYFLVTDFVELERQPEVKKVLYKRYAVLEQGEGFVIFDLGKVK